MSSNILTDILESQRDINTHIHELEPTTPIYLYEIDLNEIQPISIKFSNESVFSDGVIRIHNDYNLFNINRGIIFWKDKAYYPFPIFGEGFDITSNGSIPTPKIKFSSQFLEDQYNSFYKYIRMQMNQLKDIVGAKVTRRKTFLRYLNGINFIGGINPFNEYDETPWASRDGDTLTIRKVKTDTTTSAINFNGYQWMTYLYKSIPDRENNIMFFNIKSIYNNKLLKQSQDSSFFIPEGSKNITNIFVNQNILEENFDNPLFYQDLFIFSGNKNNFAKIVYKDENEFTLNNSSNKIKLITDSKTKRFINDSGINISYPVTFGASNNLATFISIGSSGSQDTAPFVKYNVRNQTVGGCNVYFSNILGPNTGIGGGDGPKNYYINYLTLETGFYTGKNPETNENIKLVVLKESVNFGSNLTGEVNIAFPTTFTDYQPKILFHSNSDQNKLDFSTELKQITNSGFKFYASGATNLNSHTFNFFATDYQPSLSTPTGIFQNFSNFYNFGFESDSEQIEKQNITNAEVELTPDIFYIDRKTQEDSVNVIYELASLLDIEGVKLPGRVLLSQNCPFQYRGEGCLYEYKNRLTSAHSGIYGQVNQIRTVSFITGNAQDTNVNVSGVSTSASLSENNKSFGLETAPPVADTDDNQNTFIQIKNNGSWQDKGHWIKETNYAKGNWVHMQKNGLNYYFVCKENHASNSINAPPNTGFWVHDACSKTLNGCRARWKNNFNFTPVTIKYFVEATDFDAAAAGYTTQEEDILVETMSTPIDQDGRRLLGILPFGGFPSVEGRFRSQQSQGGQ